MQRAATRILSVQTAELVEEIHVLKDVKPNLFLQSGLFTLVATNDVTQRWPLGIWLPQLTQASSVCGT